MANSNEWETPGSTCEIPAVEVPDADSDYVALFCEIAFGRSVVGENVDAVLEPLLDKKGLEVFMNDLACRSDEPENLARLSAIRKMFHQLESTAMDRQHRDEQLSEMGSALIQEMRACREEGGRPSSASSLRKSMVEFAVAINEFLSFLEAPSSTQLLDHDSSGLCPHFLSALESLRFSLSDCDNLLMPLIDPNYLADCTLDGRKILLIDKPFVKDFLSFCRHLNEAVFTEPCEPAKLVSQGMDSPEYVYIHYLWVLNAVNHVLKNGETCGNDEYLSLLAQIIHHIDAYVTQPFNGIYAQQNTYGRGGGHGQVHLSRMNAIPALEGILNFALQLRDVELLLTRLLVLQEQAGMQSQPQVNRMAL